MKKITYLTSIAMLTSLSASAEVKINGFANMIGGITSSGDEALYSYQDKFTFDQESLFAIQITGDVNDDMTATAQIVSRGIDDYQPGFAWAYMTYTINNNSKISAGRLRMPLYKYSASLDVGYSYHWIQPPRGIYGATFDNIEGVRYELSDFFGDLEYTWQVLVGSYDEVASVVDASDASARITFQNDINDIFSTSISLQWDWLSFRTSYSSSGASTVEFTQLEPVFQALEQTGFPEVGDLLRTSDDPGYFIDAALDIDFYDWFVGIEFASSDVEDSWLTKARYRYVTAGFRLGPFTPHITYSEERNRAKTFTDELNTVPLSVVVPFGPGGAPVPLRFVAAGLLSSFDGKSKSMILGFRYDFQPNIAFKFDVTRSDDQLGGDESATLFRAGLSLVF